MLATIEIHQESEIRVVSLWNCVTFLLQTLMYDIPLLLNLIVLPPLIYVLFHSSYWHQTELGEEKLLENWTLHVYYFKKA